MLAAGMDNFLTKPVDIYKLADALDPWLGDSSGGAPLPTTTEAADGEREPVLDLTMMREAFGGIDELAMEMLELYRNDRRIGVAI